MSQKVKTMFGVPEETAEIIYDISWWITIIAAGFAFLGALVQFKAEKKLGEFRDARDQQTALAVATANENAAKANLDVEKIKKENLELAIKLEQARQQLSGRRPPFEERPKISSKLQAIEPKVPLEIATAAQDADTTGLAWELNTLFGMAGWEAKPGTYSGGFVSGITIFARIGGTSAEVNKMINAIQKTLNESNLGPVHFSTAADVRQGTIRIVVGPKEIVEPVGRRKQ